MTKQYSGEELGELLLQSVKEMKAGKKAHQHKIELTPAAQARQKSGLSQSAFANLLGISKRTLQGWEQGVKKPSGPAQVLIKIAETHPEILKEINNDSQQRV